MKTAFILLTLITSNAHATKPKDLLGKWEGKKVEKSPGSTYSLKVRLIGKRLSDGSIQLIEADAPFLPVPVKQTLRYTFRPDGRFTETLVTVNPLGPTSTVTSGRGTWRLAGGRITVEAKYHGVPTSGIVTVDGGSLNLVLRQNFVGKFSTTLRAHR